MYQYAFILWITTSASEGTRLFVKIRLLKSAMLPPSLPSEKTNNAVDNVRFGNGTKIQINKGNKTRIIDGATSDSKYLDRDMADLGNVNNPPVTHPTSTSTQRESTIAWMYSCTSMNRIAHTSPKTTQLGKT